MAASTCEGVTLPEEQAEPDDSATPSTSKAATMVSAERPGRAKAIVLPTRAASLSEYGDFRRNFQHAGLQYVAQLRKPPGLGNARKLGLRRGGAKACDGGDIFGAAPKTPFLSATTNKRLGQQIAPNRRPARPRPWDRRACGSTGKAGRRPSR